MQPWHRSLPWLRRNPLQLYLPANQPKQLKLFPAATPHPCAITAAIRRSGQVPATCAPPAAVPPAVAKNDPHLRGCLMFFTAESSLSLRRQFRPPNNPLVCLTPF